MIATMLMAMIADIVFDSVGKTKRAYEAEIDRYFRERGLLMRPQPKPAR